jgi:tRNA(fMet)-specific endonuclease VapC
MIYALDSNVIIGLLNGHKSVTEGKDTAIADGVRFIIPPIVDYEVRRGFFYKSSPKKEKLYDSLAGYYGIGDFPSGIWMRAAHIYAQLRSNGRTVGDADILIAAFCLINGYTLVTSNTKDFIYIDGLRMVDWAA